uniref:Uncharacterized protein n=1 Tax=Cannabis sativa TaxID=3483 RepID=A0A803QYQ4_CANSA
MYAPKRVALNSCGLDCSKSLGSIGVWTAMGIRRVLDYGSSHFSGYLARRNSRIFEGIDNVLWKKVKVWTAIWVYRTKSFQGLSFQDLTRQ